VVHRDLGHALFERAPLAERPGFATLGGAVVDIQGEQGGCHGRLPGSLGGPLGDHAPEVPLPVAVPGAEPPYRDDDPAHDIAEWLPRNWNQSIMCTKRDF